MILCPVTCVKGVSLSVNTLLSNEHRYPCDYSKLFSFGVKRSRISRNAVFTKGTMSADLSLQLPDLLHSLKPSESAHTGVTPGESAHTGVTPFIPSYMSAA